MNKIVRISRYLLPFKWNLIVSISLMMLTALFSISTLALIAPFLNLLFGQTELVTEPAKLQFGMDSIIHFFNFKMSEIIIFKGKVYALIFVGLLVLFTTLFKNIFFYFSKFFMIPARGGVVTDIRNKIYKKILNLPLGYFSEERKGDIISRVAQDAQEIEISIIR